MDIKYRGIGTINEFIDAIRIRANVFVVEQGFKPGYEPDEDDKVSRHFIAIVNDKIVSTARFRELSKGEFKIERIATMKEYRGKYIGVGLVEYIVKEILKLKPKKIWLRSQVQSKPFYEKCGFNPISEPFGMWGVKHIDMEYPL